MLLNGWILTAWVVPLITVAKCSWESPSSGQYHIQTDEGPERYFRFQTDNGQFRKEKRLQDGTVIGTEAWIDAAGILRQKDYIADDKGYRILKSKTIYVGHGRAIEEAIKSTKSVQTKSGIFASGNNGLSSHANSVLQSVDNKNGAKIFHSTTESPFTPIAVSSTTSTTIKPTHLGYLSPVEAAKIEPSSHLGFDHYPDELPQTRLNQHPHRVHQLDVHIRPHSEPVDSLSSVNTHEYSSTSKERSRTPSPSLPALAMQPPFENVYRRLRPIAIASTTPAPIASHDVKDIQYSTPAPFESYSSTTSRSDIDGYHYAPPVVPTYRNYDGRQPAALPLDINNLGALLPPLPPTNHRLRLQPHSPISNNALSGYESQSEDYPRQGFRYVLPRQYHEEEQIDERMRAGSFGYVDPFGIRRVVYYNALPGRGFVHRNSNRYVGLEAPPYDTRPPRV